MCDGNELAEKEQEASLAALQRTIDRDEKRGHATIGMLTTLPSAGWKSMPSGIGQGR